MSSLLFISAYILNWILSSTLHFIAYYRGTNSKADIIVTSFLKMPKNKKEIIYFLLSPDYYSASSLKNNNLLKTNKHYYGNFIRKSNIYNFIYSGVLFVAIFWLPGHLQPILVFIKFFCGVRVVSRSFEIMIAFVRDVIDNNKKTSDIESNERIKLAIFSYFEIIIIYAGIYFLLFDHLQSGSSVSIFFYIYKSIGISTFTNVSYSCYSNFIESFPRDSFKILQLFTSISLLYFALAKYISSKK
ncbi:MAG: hypothetical protein ACOCV1_05840 [Bacillota bacterium]